MKKLLKECAEYICLHPDNDTSVDLLERIARLMGDDHVEFGGYWESLRKACINEEVPLLSQKEITA